MVLFEQESRSDPMVFIEEITPRKLLRELPLEMIASQPELDALLMAFTAWLAWNKPDQVRRHGLPKRRDRAAGSCRSLAQTDVGKACGVSNYRLLIIARERSNLLPA